MSYFTEVYLKRFQKDGDNRQDRVMSKKEREFDRLFLSQTQYYGIIHDINCHKEMIECSLQPNKKTESQEISYLLISTKNKPFHTGDIISIRQKIKNIEHDKKWLIIDSTDNITQGYFRYKVICLNHEIGIIDEYGNTTHIIPVRFNSGTGATLEDFYNQSAAMYREPDRSLKIWTRYEDFLKKDVYFNYKNKGWTITGIDNISIDGVAVLSISESLKREAEPLTSEDILVGEEDNFFLNNR